MTLVVVVVLVVPLVIFHVPDFRQINFHLLQSSSSWIDHQNSFQINVIFFSYLSHATIFHNLLIYYPTILCFNPIFQIVQAAFLFFLFSLWAHDKSSKNFIFIFFFLLSSKLNRSGQTNKQTTKKTFKRCSNFITHTHTLPTQ